MLGGMICLTSCTEKGWEVKIRDKISSGDELIKEEDWCNNTNVSLTKGDSASLRIEKNQRELQGLRIRGRNTVNSDGKNDASDRLDICRTCFCSSTPIAAQIWRHN